MLLAAAVVVGDFGKFVWCTSGSCTLGLILTLGDPERETKRPLGLIILRGENIVSLTAEAPPSQTERRGDLIGSSGPGKAIPINRTGMVGSMALEGNGIQQAPMGLGVPNPNSMAPKSS